MKTDKTAEKFIYEDEEYFRSEEYVLSSEEMVELLNNYLKYRMASDEVIDAKADKVNANEGEDEALWFLTGAKWLKQLLS